MIAPWPSKSNNAVKATLDYRVQYCTGYNSERITAYALVKQKKLKLFLQNGKTLIPRKLVLLRRWTPYRSALFTFEGQSLEVTGKALFETILRCKLSKKPALGFNVSLAAALISLILALMWYSLTSFFVEPLSNIIPAQSRAAILDTSRQFNLMLMASDQRKIEECVNEEGHKAILALIERFELRKDVPNLKLRVLHSEVQNAFTLANGEIWIINGIKDVARTPDQIMAVVAHETGHAAQRDPERMAASFISTNQASYLVTSSYGTNFLSLAAYFILMNRDTRQLEKRADDYMLKMLNEKEYNSKGILGFFKNISQEGSWLEETLEPLSSHPAPSNRIKRLSPETRIGKPAMSNEEWHAFTKICDKRNILFENPLYFVRQSLSR